MLVVINDEQYRLPTTGRPEGTYQYAVFFEICWANMEPERDGHFVSSITTNFSIPAARVPRIPM